MWAIEEPWVGQIHSVIPSCACLPKQHEVWATICWKLDLLPPRGSQNGAAEGTGLEINVGKCIVCHWLHTPFQEIDSGWAKAAPTGSYSMFMYKPDKEVQIRSPSALGAAQRSCQEWPVFKKGGNTTPGRGTSLSHFRAQMAESFLSFFLLPCPPHEDCRRERESSLHCNPPSIPHFRI